MTDDFVATDRAPRSHRAARACVALIAGIAIVALSGCGPQRRPVIPRAAYTERTDHREAIEGSDTTRARLTWPDFVGARRPESLDSLRATVDRLLLAPAGIRREPAGSAAALMDGFIADWNETRKATRSSAWWRFDRRVEVLAETLGVVSLAVTETAYTGGAHSMTSVRFVYVDADLGNTLGFADLFREELRDSLSAVLEPLFREARGIAPDSSLKAAGFLFEDDRFHVNENVAITRDGLRWRFDPYEIAPYSTGATEMVVSFATARPFAKPGGPLERHGR